MEGKQCGNTSSNIYQGPNRSNRTEDGTNASGSSHFSARTSNYRTSSLNQRRADNFRDKASNRDNRTKSTYNAKPRERFAHSLGFMFLQDLVKHDTEKILLQLVKERKGFKDLLEKELTTDCIVLVIKILTKVSTSSFSDTKYSILHSSFNETFINKLKTFIACLPAQDTFQKRASAYFWKDPTEFCTNLLTICEDLLHTTPTFACKTLPVLLNSIKIYLPIIEQEHDIEITGADDIKRRGETLQGMIKIFIKEHEEQQNALKETPSETSKEPPDSFREIDVYPSAEEVVGGRGFLRENVTQGAYQSVEHYLDVQFRLLREDFVGPLRDGIANHRSSVPGNHLDNVRVHKDIQFLNTETINEFYCLRIQFVSKKKKKAYSFENSKRFMYGSLLCFTKDNFQTLIFGKVAQRQIEDLNKGQIIVAFDERLDIDYSVPYVMVECGVYFEPYFHVLTVLKKMNEDNFPMERYIIRVNPVVQAPEYLTDPKCIYEVEGHQFSPLSEWPNENLYNLNESQMIAFKAAITQEIVVIQGPPGTGKTYMGLKIAETLLRNIDCWYDHTPILVICFTNHALDQFLEGLIPITDRIVRVGGQSKNTNLDRFNLRHKIDRDSAVSAKRYEVQNCLREIKHTTEKLQQIDYYNSVLTFKHFSEFIPDFEDSWFAVKNDSIIRWLLEGADHEQVSYHGQNNLDNLQAQEEFNMIGINDDVATNQPQIDIDFIDHHIPKFDSIFEEVLSQTPALNSHSFLITLGSMREEIRKCENSLLQFTYNEYPTLQERIREQELMIYTEKLKHRYEYVKRHLTEGRHLQNTVEVPKAIDILRPFNISFERRWKLYFYWLNLYKRRESNVLNSISQDFPTIYKEYEELRKIEDVRAMKNALVVGMTTTSAARLRSSLQTLKNPIVIVEEAAEVLEAHIVTSITKHCKHLILIGDHKQLRPNTANFRMEKQYRLGISLFERMIINNIHCYTLNIQHRMRPEISCLIRPAIYEFLEDHPSVFQRPVITGVDNCIFFIDHDHQEEVFENSSKINQHEVSFLIYLARHLVLNGCNAENITILAAYLGQFFEFKKAKKGHLDLLQEMKIAVLDNFQGEESDIILLSLVRNNEDNKIGFLSIENRVCVALSRAKNGLYIMGNMAQLCSESKLWQKIKTSLERQDALGDELPLRCQIHQDQVRRVKSETDFYSISEGGCSKKCDMDLKCGHKCSYLCHIRDRGHLHYKCQTECAKPLCKKDETHVCKKMCFEDCGPCSYMVQRTLTCGHEVNIPCHIDPQTYRCQIKVPSTLPCGHHTDKPCYSDPETFLCPNICDVQVQPCGHSCELSCHIRNDPDHQEYQCSKPCTKFRKDCSVKEDDHRCKRLCYQECDPCTITVRKRRTLCPHLYDVSCNSDVDTIICEKPCKKVFKCGHPCIAKCNQPCPKCQMNVPKIHPLCKHSIRSKCSEPPDRKFCNKQCPLQLPCGHRCTKKCNEPCTTKCTVLVECSGITAECGHLVTRTECHMTTSSVDPKLLLKYCKEPCSKELKCGHSCSGSCGECSQGRVHKRCSQKCGVLLVCDHPCEIPCRQACRPCIRICQYRCQHSICRKTCGEVCTPCKERCSRRCKHQWCTKFCGDICNVLPCVEPCGKKLKCGHPCIGFCGDPCPPKCMVCDKDELLEVFFGTETEDARYVLLNDCKHIVEHGGMEEWLQQNQEQISYKLCPVCKTAIRTTQRYSDFIKRAIRDVAKVKVKANGRIEDIREAQEEIQLVSKQLLMVRCRPLLVRCPQMACLLTAIRARVQANKKGRRPNINIYEAQSLKSKLQLLDYIAEICCNKHVVIATSREIFFPQVDFILAILSRDVDYITNQEIEDVTLEIKRLSRMVEFSCLQKCSQFSHYSTSNDVAKALIASVQQNVFSCKRFTNEDNDFLKTVLAELNDAMKSGLAISDRERKEILQAMGFSKGHWFKCPNGHVYAIGECGGAMEEAVCNECGARIGGRRHRLLGDNAVATEMDGATYGAFSARANLQNYDLQNL